jgi:transaldolase
MTKLRELHDRFGQSPWLDNLERRGIASGELAGWVGDGMRGITSNPTIFAKAMASSDAYDEQLKALLGGGLDSDTAYWRVAEADVGAAADVLRPLYDEAEGRDGYVSIEVDPRLAHDTGQTVAAARRLWGDLARPNVFIKVPATEAGVPAVRRLIAEGINVNVTLIFSLTRYEAVMEAYLAGVEELVDGGGDPTRVASVASFFVSRVDAEVDARLESIGSERALALRGKAAVAQAQMAYQRFLGHFAGPRWERLAAAGARVQRPLWASTSTKNPAYRDTLYVDQLIGPDTVNTMPEATLRAFCDHGRLERTVDADPAGAQAIIDELAGVGVPLDEVTDKLEHEGVAAFTKSFDEVMTTLAGRADDLRP